MCSEPVKVLPPLDGAAVALGPGRSVGLRWQLLSASAGPHAEAAALSGAGDRGTQQDLGLQERVPQQGNGQEPSTLPACPGPATADRRPSGGPGG